MKISTTVLDIPENQNQSNKPIKFYPKRGTNGRTEMHLHNGSGRLELPKLKFGMNK